ncbi:MAG TPA: tetratricopeptide repeat protein, partial [Chthoniobacterales bacterium]|nr:tetratricopeptide repeat protein [Chthoniobacterales bacterium]
MRPLPLRGGCVALNVAFLAITASLARAQQTDPSIDRLLSKLPPPEKIVKPAPERAMQSADPAGRDPLVGGIFAAVKAGNGSRAHALARQLTERHPRSAGAFVLRGVIASALRQFGDARISYKTASTLQPNLSAAHLGLAQVEGMQGRPAGAIPHLQRYVQMEPKAAVGWFALSDCALRVGRKSESVTYARKATALAPSDALTWVQLARAERAVGNNEGTLTALSRAADVSPDSGVMLATVGYTYINLNRISQAIPPLMRAARLMPDDGLVHAQ